MHVNFLWTRGLHRWANYSTLSFLIRSQWSLLGLKFYNSKCRLSVKNLWDVRNRLTEEVISEPTETIWESNPPTTLPACSDHIPLWLRAKVHESNKWQMYAFWLCYLLIIWLCATVVKWGKKDLCGHLSFLPLLLFFEGVSIPMWDHFIQSFFIWQTLKFFF